MKTSSLTEKKKYLCHQTAQKRCQNRLFGICKSYYPLQENAATSNDNDKAQTLVNDIQQQTLDHIGNRPVHKALRLSIEDKTQQGVMYQRLIGQLPF